ncbi:acyl-CoA dehydrogenase family protein [Paenarthrobacter sp. NPDC090520]|uniref:acyl-CoA dehydrogenase family protein n=1 Tax=Paenarthrobacter sp. NPDC090520 TaxID=3364382 RepID=UPI003813EE42
MDESTSTAQPVRINSEPAQLQALQPLIEAVGELVGDVPALLEIAKDIGRTAPHPGEGSTGKLWEVLASVTAVDVAAGRVLEPHLDAVHILAQAGQPEPEGAWGVFAAEGPGMRLEAARDQSGNNVLNGAKPWCSLASQLDGAVITAHLPGGQGRAAFAVNLQQPGVTCETPEWTSRGLREIPSGTVHFEQVPATLLQGPGWYHERPGFAWGGIGVAACWLGGAVGLARDFAQSLTDAADKGREPDQLALAHLGEIDRLIASAAALLARTAERIDAILTGAGPSAWSEAQRARGTVAAAVERIQALVSQNRGPGPLAFDEWYGKQMADLSLYVRQHHAMRDDAQLGSLALKGDRAW